MQLGKLLEVVRFEKVGPQHGEMVFDHLGLRLLHRNAATTEDLVVAVVVLLRGLEHRLGLDPSLGRVVHTTEQVAVGMCYPRRLEESHKNTPSSQAQRSSTLSDDTPASPGSAHRGGRYARREGDAPSRRFNLRVHVRLACAYEFDQTIAMAHRPLRDRRPLHVAGPPTGRLRPHPSPGTACSTPLDRGRHGVRPVPRQTNSRPRWRASQDRGRRRHDRRSPVRRSLLVWGNTPRRGMGSSLGRCVRPRGQPASRHRVIAATSASCPDPTSLRW